MVTHVLFAAADAWRYDCEEIDFKFQIPRSTFPLGTWSLDFGIWSLGFLDSFPNLFPQPIHRLWNGLQKRLPFRFRQRNMNDAIDTVRDVKLVIHFGAIFS